MSEQTNTPGKPGDRLTPGKKAEMDALAKRVREGEVAWDEAIMSVLDGRKPRPLR